MKIKIELGSRFGKTEEARKFAAEVALESKIKEALRCVDVFQRSKTIARKLVILTDFAFIVGGLMEMQGGADYAERGYRLGEALREDLLKEILDATERRQSDLENTMTMALFCAREMQGNQ